MPASRCDRRDRPCAGASAACAPHPCSSLRQDAVRTPPQRAIGARSSAEASFSPPSRWCNSTASVVTSWGSHGVRGGRWRECRLMGSAVRRARRTAARDSPSPTFLRTPPGTSEPGASAHDESLRRDACPAPHPASLMSRSFFPASPSSGGQRRDFTRAPVPRRHRTAPSPVPCCVAGRRALADAHRRPPQGNRAPAGGRPTRTSCPCGFATGSRLGSALFAALTHPEARPFHPMGWGTSRGPAAHDRPERTSTRSRCVRGWGQGFGTVLM